MPKRVLLLSSLCGVAILALVMRSTSLPHVFAPDGRVYLDIHDSAYHARVALYDFVNFPTALRFDPLMAYPDGAPVQNPFLFDWAVAGMARLFGATPRHFEVTAAWASPVLATLETLVVFAMGRRLAGSGLGLAAAAIFAVLPASLRRSQVGDLDHHAAVAFLGALLLWGSLELARTSAQRASSIAAALLLCVARVAVVLTWSGSLLYVGLCEGALLLTAIVENRPPLLWAQSAGALGAAAIVALYLGSDPDAIGAAFTTTTLSWFHVVALALAGVTGALTALALARGRRWSPGQRLAAGVAIGSAVSVAALALAPVLREALLPSLSFLAGADEWAAGNTEQVPLYGSGRGIRNFGLLAYLLPLTVLGPALLVREDEQRGPGICLLCWTLVLGALAILQIRYANDFAAAGSLAVALLARRGSLWLGDRMPAPAARLAVGAGIGLLLWPGWEDGTAFRRALAHARGEPVAEARMDARRTLAVFAEMVRETTPEVDSERPGARPGYGVLTPPTFGSTIHYYARRATPANNFGPYLDREKFRLARQFYRVRDEAEALTIAERLRTRYVMSYAHELAHREFFIFSLHEHDRPVGGGHAERLRLVLEGPADGMVFTRFFPSLELPEGTIPYKLFEVVPGAVLEGRGAPGAPFSAELEIVTNLGRRFRFEASTRADASGVARLRVPYASALMSKLPTRSTGPYRVRLGVAEAEAYVSEADVQEGNAVRVAAFGAGG